MKKLILLMLLLVFSLQAKDAVLMEDLNSFGFWGGPRVGMTHIDGQVGMLVGGRGMLTINRHLAIGGGGWGLVTNVDTKAAVPDFEHITLDYGGFIIEYIGATEKAAHFNAGVLLGGGKFSFRNDILGDSEGYYDQKDRIYVVEPHVALELNITQFMRLQLSGSYRLAFDVDFEPYEMGDISGPNLGLFFKFGYDFEKSNWEKIEEIFD